MPTKRRRRHGVEIQQPEPPSTQCDSLLGFNRFTGGDPCAAIVPTLQFAPIAGIGWFTVNRHSDAGSVIESLSANAITGWLNLCAVERQTPVADHHSILLQRPIGGEITVVVKSKDPWRNTVNYPPEADHS